MTTGDDILVHFAIFSDLVQSKRILCIIRCVTTIIIIVCILISKKKNMGKRIQIIRIVHELSFAGEHVTWASLLNAACEQRAQTAMEDVDIYLFFYIRFGCWHFKPKPTGPRRMQWIRHNDLGFRPNIRICGSLVFSCWLKCMWFIERSIIKNKYAHPYLSTLWWVFWKPEMHCSCVNNVPWVLTGLIHESAFSTISVSFVRPI